MSFTVDEYRKPDFQVAVTTDKPEYLQGDSIQLAVHSSYFFGGDVSDAGLLEQVGLATPGDLLMECGMHGAPLSYDH